MKIYYGNSIKIYRILNRLSQEKLAYNLKISKSMLGMIENNRRNASYEIEERIRKTLKIPLDKTSQQLLLEELKTFLIEILNSHSKKTSTKINKEDINTNLKNLPTIELIYYNKLRNNDFIEIDLLLQDLYKKLPVIHNILHTYYIRNEKLQDYYNTYTSFLLDNVQNLIDILKEYLSVEAGENEIIVFKERLPFNIVNNFEKIIKNIDSTTYSDYTKYKLNNYSFNKQIGFVITDESMNPKYETENIVIVDIIKTLEEIENNKDYLIRVDKEYIVRRIQIEDDDFLLKPLNYNYDIKIFTKENIKELNIEIIGKVTDIKIN
jgi:transcriptional regulator with XRE-family HTH domain